MEKKIYGRYLFTETKLPQKEEKKKARFAEPQFHMIEGRNLFYQYHLFRITEAACCYLIEIYLARK